MNRPEMTIPDTCERLILCGGPYSNFSAVRRFLEVTAHEPFRFCLGDIGGFGPCPNLTLEAIREAGLVCIQGNYDHAVGHGQADCGCGYLDPLDRKFSQLSFEYTLKNTAHEHREWLRTLPAQMILNWRGARILLCHGSPDEVNEFVWQSETGDEKISSWLQKFEVDGICCTHSGLPWIRETSGFWLNAGVLGRPAHEGRPHVYYASLDFPQSAPKPKPKPVLHSLDYDARPVIEAMKSENLPVEFSRALEEGIWTTCYKILPEAESVVQPRLLK